MIKMYYFDIDMKINVINLCSNNEKQNTQTNITEVKRWNLNYL